MDFIDWCDRIFFVVFWTAYCTAAVCVLTLVFNWLF